MDFDTACDVVRASLFTATNQEKLELYALFRIAKGRATEARGDDDDRGGSVIELAKREAVRQRAHLSPQEAAEHYTRIVEQKLMAATG